MRSFLCSICGETNPKAFYGNEKSCCKTCRVIINGKKIEQTRLSVMDKLGSVCVACNDNRTEALEAHHVYPDQKHRGKTVIYCLSKADLTAEVKKLICLCGSCHNILHFYSSPNHATREELDLIKTDKNYLVNKGLRSIGLDPETLHIGPISKPGVKK